MKTQAKEIIDFLIVSAPKTIIVDLVSMAQDMLDCGKSIDSVLCDMDDVIQSL